MTAQSPPSRHARVSELLVAKLAEHGTLDPSDEAAVRALSSRLRTAAPGEDLVCQGDRPDVAIFVLGGMLARYHTLPSGERQYLTFYVKGEMPDVQSLFLKIMDHSVCALDHAELACLPHDELRKLITAQPGVGFAMWRAQLVDAAITRQAVTNNSARSHVARLAHLFCEIYYRSREALLVQGKSCSLPLSQIQLGQALGMSHISVNRAMRTLRTEELAEHRGGTLEILSWAALKKVAGFDPTYLHVDKKSEMARTRFTPDRH